MTNYIFPADAIFEDPAEFDFNSQVTVSGLLDKLITNPDFNKCCDWLAGRALEDGVVFKTDKSVSYKDPKRGPVQFTEFYKYVQYIGAWENLRMAISYSRLLGESVMFFRSDEYPPGQWEQSGRAYYKEIEFNVETPFTETMVFHPFDGQNGYEIVTQDPITLIPEIFKFSISDKTHNTTEKIQDKSTVVIFAHASNCVFFSEPSKRGGTRGAPRSYLLYHLAHAKEIQIKSVSRTMLKLSAGVAVMQASSSANADEMDLHVKDLSYIDRMYVEQGTKIDESIQFFVPDIKIQQLAELILMTKKELASAMGISLRSLGEEDIAAGMGEGGAKFSNILQRAEIQDIRTHYNRPIMYMFYLLGQDKPEFEWDIDLYEAMHSQLEFDDNDEFDDKSEQNQSGSEENRRPDQKGDSN